jgi:hypothetical protein
MTRQSNSKIEQYYFEQFRRDCPLPEGGVDFTDKPDVIVRADPTLGVEITNHYIVAGSDPASKQIQRRRREKVLDRAHAAFLSEGGKKFELSVAFDPLKLIEELETLTLALTSLAHKLETAETGQVSSLLFEHIEALRFVYLNAKEYSDPRRRLIQGFSVPSLSVERLREVVIEKSARVCEY